MKVQLIQDFNKTDEDSNANEVSFTASAGYLEVDEGQVIHNATFHAMMVEENVARVTLRDTYDDRFEVAGIDGFMPNRTANEDYSLKDHEIFEYGMWPDKF